MGSLGTGEIIFIAIVALVVFGPKRLPELARKASDLLRQARQATQSFTDAMDSEYDGVTAPLKDMKAEYDETMRTIKGMVPTTPLASFTLPDGKPSVKRDKESEASGQSTADATGENLEITDAADQQPSEPSDQPLAVEDPPDETTAAEQTRPTVQEREATSKPAEEAGETAVDDGGGS